MLKEKVRDPVLNARGRTTSKVHKNTLMKHKLKGALLLSLMGMVAASSAMAAPIDTDQLGQRGERRQAVRDAIANDDYAAFQAAVTDSRWGQQFDEDKFEILVEAYELRQDGEHEAARELLRENNIHRPGKRARLFRHITDEQRDTLRQAREDGDRDAARAILQEIRDQIRNS